MTNPVVAPERFHLYDTTLRDGAQQEGIQLTVEGKLKIARLLDQLGVNFIEGGWPGANPNDTAFFDRAKTELELANAQLVAFGSTRKAGLKASEDPQVEALLAAGTQYVCIVAKSHDRHVFEALRTTLAENLEMVADTVSYLVANGRKVFVDLEHFFNGYQDNPEYALEVLRVAAEAGASVVVLCDTNGGMLPSQMGDIVSAAGAIGVDLGIHCHNDTGCAVANSMAAIEAGVIHVQGTINGYGERTGNADLTTLIGNLQLKWGWPVVSQEQLAGLYRTSHAIADLTNQRTFNRQPYVGNSAFAHKAGLHASAIKANEDLYQHTQPAQVGNYMRMLISDMAGAGSVQIKASQLGYDLVDRQLADQIVATVKEREAQGYSYEAADASFELLLLEQLGELDKPFVIESWRVYTEQVKEELGDSEAVLKVSINGVARKEFGHGNGPVNALDHALGKSLEIAFPKVSQIRLTDYRVRVIGRGTDAVVRTFIDLTDGYRTWTTVGVGTNVVEASWEALQDGYLFGLVKSA